MSRRGGVALVAAAALTLPMAGAVSPAGAAVAPAYDKTSPAEAARVDGVPAPALDWFACFDLGECATAELPLDYDDPEGPTTEVALGRVNAADPGKRVGTLFLNPGGPGGSAVQMALLAPYFFSQDILDRFDVVGIDPRGVAYSANVRCFRNMGQQGEALAGMNVAFPWGTKEEAAFIASAKAFGKACSTTGQPLVSAMSTAEVARDMDVVRRTLGDKRLTYIGFSYGTQLGQVYANLFPDRVRALAIDGVVDPVGWVGTEATRDRPSTDRIRSADGAWRALHEFLLRCDKAGGAMCTFSLGDPVDNFARIADRLKAEPLVLEDEAGTYTLTYASFVATVLSALYDPTVGASLADVLTDILILIEPPATTKASPAERASARATLRTRMAKLRTLQADGIPGFEFPYENSLDAFTTVLCTDGRNPANARQWVGWGVKADARAPYFGRAWLWPSAPCASSTWTARDDDAYPGPFTKRTVNPVLVVGNYYDPATNYDSAVKVASLLPNSRLLTSDSWGHAAYGTSACVADAVAGYLIRKALPAKGTICVGDSQPFAAEAARGTPAPGAASRAPVVPFVPPGVQTTPR